MLTRFCLTFNLFITIALMEYAVFHHPPDHAIGCTPGPSGSVAYHYNSWPLIGRKSALRQFEFF